MAVTTRDNRTIFNEGDDNTGWNTGSATTTAFAEPTASIAVAINEDEGPIFYDSGSQIALSGQMVYVYSQVVATQLSWTTGAHGLYIAAGTDDINFHQSGSDREVFKHNSGPVGFQCFLLDCGYADQKDTAGETTEINGTFAGLWTDIQNDNVDEIGAYYINQSKALGGGVNSYCDIIRYGNHGITMFGGSAGDPAVLLDIVELDRSTTINQKAHGIIREYTAGIYGCQGPLNFGDVNVASGIYFVDDGAVLVFEDRDVLDDKFYINVQGHASATSRFELSNSTVSTAGPYVSFSAASGNFDDLILDTVVFSNLGNEVTFSSEPDSSGHYISDCTFVGCGVIDPGITHFTNNTIANPVPSSTGGLVLYNDTGASNRWSGLNFISGGAGHAIYITESGYYTFSNFAYIGYGSTGTTDAEVYNDSGGGVNIIVDGGSAPTYRNGVAGSTTTLVSSVPITITVKDVDGNLINGVQVAMYEGTTQIMNSAPFAGVATKSYTGSTPASVEVRIRKGSSIDSPKYLPISSSQTIDENGLTVTFTLLEDTNNNA